MSTTPIVSDTPTSAPPESVASALAPFRPAFWFGGFNGLTWMVSLGTPMVLLAQHLGASAFQVGLASSFVFLLLPIQVISTAALPHLGFKKQMVTAWLVRSLFLVVPLALVWIEFEAPAPWMPAALVASVFGFCLCRAFGTAAHLPWIAAIVPLGLRGRFFGTEQAITSIVGVGTLLTCAALFASLPGHAAFTIVYMAAVVGAFLAAWNLTRLPDAPAPAAPPLGKMWSHAVRLCGSSGLFRHYLLLKLTGAVVTSSIAAFTAYYLKSAGQIASSEIMFLTAVAFGGQIVGTGGIRHLLDRFPLRRFFQISSAVICLVDLFWLALLSGADGLVPWLGVPYFLVGVGVGMMNVTHFTYLPELAEEAERPITMAIFTAALGLLSGVAPILWGLVLREPGPMPAMNVQAFVVFFAVGLGLNAALVLLYARLPDLRPTLARS